MSVIILATIFGIVAGVVMAMTSYFIKERLSDKGKRATIEIPIEETSTEEVSEPESSEQVEDIVASAIESIDLSEIDLEKMYAGLTAIADEKDAAVVKIYSITTDTDWFNNILQNESSSSGLVIARSGSNFIILAPSISADSGVRVEFYEGGVTDATVLGTDAMTGLMILSADTAAIDKEMQEIEPVVLGNSYQLKRGEFIIAVGSPMGRSGSIDIGNITSLARNVSFFDGYGRVIYCDKHLDNKGTFLLNTSGELVGIVSNLDYGTEVSAAYGISDLKLLIENMTNGAGSSYLGVRAVDIDKDKAPGEMPDGIYVSEVRADSPAYNTGIQAGDIISMIGSEEIDSISEFKNIMEKLKPNQVLNIKVSRQSKEGFTEIDFETTIGARS